MSQQLPPEVPHFPGDTGTSPPPPNWTPTPLSAAGKASYVGKPGVGQIGPGQGKTDSAIDAYRPKRSVVPLIVALVGALVAGLVIYSTTRPSESTNQPSPSPARSTSTPAGPRDGTPFITESSGASGVWKIAESRWTSTGLNVLIEVRVESGELSCYFNAMPSDGQKVVRGTAGQLDPQFRGELITAGSRASGWVFLPVERGTTLVFLRTKDQPQVSGIEVAG